jgi:iron complex transport system ATP-binding protein
VSIVATDLAAGYSRRPVLAGVTLAVGPGEAVALVGANGSGKSCLLLTLAGLLAPLAGQLRWSGRPRLPGGAARVRELGVLLQQESPPGFRVQELVGLGLALDRPPGARERGQVDAAVARVGLEAVAQRRCTELSGGQWQRARLARAVVANPAALLLDEPTNHLDPGGRAELMGLIDKLRDNLRGALSLVMATHDLQLAGRCDRVLALAAGRVVAVGAPRQVLTPATLGQVFGAHAAKAGWRDRACG